MEKRKAELSTALAKIGLEYRVESALHEAYIMGKNENLTIGQVVNKTAVQKYLHEYTDYVNLMSQAYDASNKTLSRTQLIGRAKSAALNEHPIPKIWPWLVDEEGFTLVTN